MTETHITKTVREELEQHLVAIMEIAHIHQLPTFIEVMTDNTDEGTEYAKKIYTAQSAGLEIADDRVRKHLLIEAGFEPVPPREAITLDMEEIFDAS